MSGSSCQCQNTLSFAICMAFQPIVDLRSGQAYAYEALVRGSEGQGAGWVLAQVSDHNRHAFDQTCRVSAVRQAAALAMPARLHINFLPGVVYKPENCIRTTLEACAEFGFPVEQITFEITEVEKVDSDHLSRIINAYQEMRFLTAIDDFGAGFSNLGLLVEFQPDLIKLDMALIRDIAQDPVRQQLLSAMVNLCQGLAITLVAEGVETLEEARYLYQHGVYLQQGYYFAKPALDALPLLDPARLNALL